MTRLFWIKRFLRVLLPAFVVLVLGQLVQDRGSNAALLHAAIWAPITALVYVLALRYQRGKAIDAARGRSA